MKGRELTIHEISSKLVNITSAYVGYKKMLHDALKQILVLDAGIWKWQAFVGVGPETTREYKYSTFRDYLKKWSQFGFEDLKRLFVDDAEILTLLEKADTGKHGGDHGNQYTGGKTDNVSLATNEYGNGKAYTLRRLEKEAPELFDAVVSGDLSANAAAIQAGFRKKPTPFEQLMKAWEKASDLERDQFLSIIQSDL